MKEMGVKLFSFSTNMAFLIQMVGVTMLFIENYLKLDL